MLLSHLKESKTPPKAMEAGDKNSDSTQGYPARRQSSPSLLSLLLCHRAHENIWAFLIWFCSDWTYGVVQVSQVLSLPVSCSPSPVKPSVSLLGCSTSPFLNRKHFARQHGLHAKPWARHRRNVKLGHLYLPLAASWSMVSSHPLEMSLRNVHWED